MAKNRGREGDRWPLARPEAVSTAPNERHEQQKPKRSSHARPSSRQTCFPGRVSTTVLTRPAACVIYNAAPTASVSPQFPGDDPRPCGDRAVASSYALANSSNIVADQLAGVCYWSQSRRSDCIACGNEASAAATTFRSPRKFHQPSVRDPDPGLCPRWHRGVGRWSRSMGLSCWRGGTGGLPISSSSLARTERQASCCDGCAGGP